MRRMQMTPGPRPSLGAGSPSKGTVAGRYGSPTTPRFAQSVRGTAGDPAKRGPGARTDRSLGPRSVSALGFDDDDATPTLLARPKANNGSVGSVSSFSNKLRSPSRANGDDEVERLRAQLEDRDRQLREQTATLSDMENSLTELQSLMDQPGGPKLGTPGPDDDKDTSQLRALLREKNEKIAMLTAEFDSHRADFRSTIDALEMASTETVRVYEAQKKELAQEVQELTSRLEDVDSVASQLKQLEDLVQDLEEGLEDARRGEAEARGEVEFLRGEVERTKAELQREKEKMASAGPNKSASANEGADASTLSKDLEQKDDEIRGLKAIIHSLSRDSGSAEGGESAEQKRTREKLEREVADLRAMLEGKAKGREETEREVETVRKPNGNQRQSAMSALSAKRSSYRDSRDTVVPSWNQGGRSAEAPNGHKRDRTLDTMAESDAYSTATENSTLWCEICEAAGHDILTCTNMFGPDGAKSTNQSNPAGRTHHGYNALPPDASGDMKIAPLSPAKDKANPIPPQPQPQSQATPKPTLNPMDSGPLAGKESGVIDETKWCALCERDGHDSVDCPLEDAF